MFDAAFTAYLHVYEKADGVRSTEYLDYYWVPTKICTCRHYWVRSLGTVRKRRKPRELSPAFNSSPGSDQESLQLIPCQ